MRFEFFTIPVRGGEAESEVLDHFLATHRIVEIDRQFLSDSANSAWCFCVAFSESGQRPTSSRRGKIDYKEVLNEIDFAQFARLRELRKELAESEGVPAYAIFTNAQLAEMVLRKVSSATSLREISGIGEARVEKYGAAFLRTLSLARDKNRAPGEGREQ